MKSSYFMPEDKIKKFPPLCAMNNMEGVTLYAIAEPSIGEILPPPLELVDPDNPMLYLYIVNIREPTFAPWYLEGGVGVLAKYGEKTGVYFFNLLLSGPGASMGVFSGREGAGLPKKFCERIVLERKGEYGRCYMERNGVRLVDVELDIGNYNLPDVKFGMENCSEVNGGLETDGGCLLHKYSSDDSGIKGMELIYYDSPSRFYSWEPASASVTFKSSIDDPYGDIPIKSVIGAAWQVSDNWVNGMFSLYSYPRDKTTEIMRYLFSGRYDQCMLYNKHQLYETK